MTSRPVEGTFLACCDAMDEADVPYVIVGAFAASTWGRPRATQDVDVIVEVQPSDVARLVKSLSGQGLTLLADDLLDAIREGSHATAFDERSLYHIDLRPVTDDDTRTTLERASVVEFQGRQIPIASPEETVAHKLLFGSEQDVEDAEAILVRQAGDLDEPVLEERCRELGVLEDLQAMRERLEG